MTITLPPHLTGPLRLVGLDFPDADEDRLAAAGGAWATLAAGIRAQAGEVDRPATSVWTDNTSRVTGAFQGWWTDSRGPKDNLRRAAVASDLMSTSLAGMSWLVTAQKIAYITQLTALAAQLAVATGSVIFIGPAAFAADAGLILLTRAAMRRVQRAIAGRIALELVRNVDRATALLVPAATATIPKRRRQRRRGPRMVPPLPLREPVSVEEARRRCTMPPGQWLPNRPTFHGNHPVDQRTAGGGIRRVTSTLIDGGARSVRIDGVVLDPLPERQGYEDKVREAISSLGYDGAEVHALHLWGARFGDEAAAGIFGASRDLNLGEQAAAERYVRSLHEYAQTQNGYVELQATAVSHPLSVRGGGTFVAEVQYVATVCVPNREPETHPPFGFSVEPPANLRPGTYRPWADVP